MERLQATGPGSVSYSDQLSLPSSSASSASSSQPTHIALSTLPGPILQNIIAFCKNHLSRRLVSKRWNQEFCTLHKLGKCADCIAKTPLSSLMDSRMSLFWLPNWVVTFSGESSDVYASVFKALESFEKELQQLEVMDSELNFYSPICNLTVDLDSCSFRIIRTLNRVELFSRFNECLSALAAVSSFTLLDTHESHFECLSALFGPKNCVFASLKSLKIIAEGCVSDQDIVPLITCPGLSGLTSLVLVHCFQLGPTGVAEFASPSSHITNLLSLTLSGFNPDYLNPLLCSANMKNLEELSLGSHFPYQSSDASCSTLKTLGSSASMSNLKKLNIYMFAYEEISEDLLCTKLSNFDHLEELNIAWELLSPFLFGQTSSASASTSHKLFLSNLKRITVAGDFSMENLWEICSSPILQHVQHFTFEIVAPAEQPDFLHCKIEILRKFDESGNHSFCITEVDPFNAKFADSEDSNQLTVDLEFLVHEKCMKLNRLQKMRLKMCSIDTALAKILEGCTGLVQLDIWLCFLDYGPQQGGLSLLLHNLSNLTHLAIRDSGLGAKGAEIIASAPSLTNLEFLDVHELDSSPEAKMETLRTLAQSPFLSALTELRVLDDKKRGSELLESAIVVPNLTNLKRLG